MPESPLIQSFLFRDFDFFAQSISQGDVHYQQLSAGTFTGSLKQIVRRRVILSLHEMNRVILQQGSGIQGFTTFLIPGNMKQDFAWRCNRLKGNVIGVLHQGMEHHSITDQNFVGMPVSVESRYLFERAESLGYEDFSNWVSNRECFLVDAAEINVIRKRIQGVFQNPARIDSFWEEEIAISLIRLLAERKVPRSRMSGDARRRIYQKAVRFMNERVMDPLSIRDVADAVGVSERNLRYAFHEVAQMSPKRFFDRLRLNQVRRLLRSGNFQNVIDVSQSFGYWHSGKFASDYRSLFYEYPSQSLKQGHKDSF